MRFLALWVLSAALAVSMAQAEPQGSQPPQGGQESAPTKKGEPQRKAPSVSDLIMTMPAPQASIVLREHSLGPEMVTVTVLDPNYSKEVLLELCRKMGREGSPVRGLEATTLQFTAQEDSKFLRATFAADGYIDRKTGVLDVGSVVRAFMGAPKPYQLSSLSITFDGEKPGPKMVETFVDDAITVGAQASLSPPGIEYRVSLKTQDPAKVRFPGEAPPAPARPKSEAGLAPALPLPALLLIFLGAAGVAVLVYFLTLKGSKPGSTSGL